MHTNMGVVKVIPQRKGFRTVAGGEVRSSHKLNPSAALRAANWRQSHDLYSKDK